MVNIADRLIAQGASSGRERREPVWTGPNGEGHNGGVTQSLLVRFLNCRERFRLYAIEGLRPRPEFNHRLEYGSLWHICEESLAECDVSKYDRGYWWQKRLEEYCQGLLRKYPLNQPEIMHWYEVCRVQFPHYVEFWKNHPDTKERTPLLQEQPFDVPYNLPSGRRVRLRGRWDSVDLIGKGEGVGVYLQENKTKGDVNEAQLKRQLTYDMQCMFYLVSLAHSEEIGSMIGELKGVRYNVVRRPLSGGAGTIRQHKPSARNPLGESKDQYYQRLSGIIGENSANYFYRWRVEVGPHDLKRFRERCLDPILEQLCDWYDWVSSACMSDGNPWGPQGQKIHWQHPYGVRSLLNEGGTTDYDFLLESGAEMGLVRSETLFEELA